MSLPFIKRIYWVAFHKFWRDFGGWPYADGFSDDTLMWKRYRI
jgi:hypothetical protein